MWRQKMDVHVSLLVEATAPEILYAARRNHPITDFALLKADIHAWQPIIAKSEEWRDWPNEGVGLPQDALGALPACKRLRSSTLTLVMSIMVHRSDVHITVVATKAPLS